MFGTLDWLELFRWISIIVGLVGVAGFVVLCLMYPVLANTIIRVVVAVLTELLSTRMGCALITAIIVGLGANAMRESIDAKEYAARTAAFEAAQTARDAKIAADTRKLVEEELAPRLKTVADETDTAVKVFTDAVPIPPVPAANPFRVGDDACRLRSIAGAPPCGSERLGGVPQAAKRAARTIHHIRYRLPQAISPGPRPAPQGQ